MSLFTNGNARVTRLILIQLGLGVLVMVLTQVMGSLPALDFLTAKQLKITMFVFGTTLTAIRGGEMFFNKVASLYKGSGETPTIAPTLSISTGNTDLITKPQESKTTP